MVKEGLGKFTFTTREEKLPIFTKEVENLINNLFYNKCGIVHAVSDENAAYVLQYTKIDIDHEFYVVGNPIPWIEYPFHRECDYIIWLKVPYPDLSIPSVKYNMEMDNTWYLRETCFLWLSASRPAFRTKNSIIICLDEKFLDLFEKSREYLPDSVYSNLVTSIE